MGDRGRHTSSQPPVGPGAGVHPSAERIQLAVGDQTVSGLWALADRTLAVAVVAHGAGAGMEHPFMLGVAEGLAAGGVTALRFNFPYTEQGRRAPDRQGVLRDTWLAALAEAARRWRGVPLVAAGKSMGGRIASLIAAERGADFAARALVFFGYPLHAPGRADEPRDAHLASIRVPMLFIQGTQDPLATNALMEGLVRRLRTLGRMHAVEGGDHSFRIRGVRRADEDRGRELGAVAAAFIRDVV